MHRFKRHNKALVSSSGSRDGSSSDEMKDCYVAVAEGMPCGTSRGLSLQHERCTEAHSTNVLSFFLES